MIRQAQFRDPEAIARCHGNAVSAIDRTFYTEDQIAAWRSGVRPEKYQAAIDASEIFVFEEDGDIRGFGWLKSSPAEVRAIYVDPSSQGHGIGERLLGHIEKVLRDLEVKEIMVGASLNAVNFYKKYGYREGGKGSLEMQGVSVPYVLMTKIVSCSS